MAVVTIPNRPLGTDVRSIAAITANFDSILNFLNNPNLDAANLANGAVTKAKLANDALQAFLQLQNNASRKVNWGATAAVTWGSVNQIDVTVAHGLGVVPVFGIGTFEAIATQGGQFIETPVVVSNNGWDVNNLYFRCRTSDGNITNNAQPMYWLAIG